MALRDRWSNLNFKTAVATLRAANNVPQAQGMQPTWTGHHQRRLQAYALLRSYVDNESSEFRNSTSVADISNLREYGDPQLVIEQLLAALLGDSQTIVVPGAAEAREYNSTTSPQIIFEQYLRTWAEKESLTIKVAEAETNALTLGDGVYAMGWDPAKSRTRIRVYPPEMYFPVLDAEDDNEFPSRVHIAYEYLKRMPGETPKNLVRRMTWELIDSKCYFTDASWDALATQYSTATLTEPGVDSFDILQAKVIKFDKLEIPGIDFMPVIHIANTVAGAEHYGRSSLSNVLAIFDDMQNTDTDLQRAAVTAATPIIGISGSVIDTKNETVYGPGNYWSLGENGKLTAIDTAHSLDALIKLNDKLSERLSSNARIPEALLGKVDPTKAPSGLAIALTYSPLKSNIGQKRPLREYKYSLLLKFVLRFAIAAKLAGDTDPSLKALPNNLNSLTEMPRLVFGNYLPSDLTETITNVVALLQNKAISHQTALQMLQEAGIPIADISVELERLQQSNLEGAKLLFDASGGDTQAVGVMLGINIAKPPAPTVVNSNNTNPLATLPGN